MNKTSVVESKSLEHCIEVIMKDRQKGNGLTQRERLLLETELVCSQERVRRAKSDLQSRFRYYTEEVARMNALEQMLSAHTTMH